MFAFVSANLPCVFLVVCTCVSLDFTTLFMNFALDFLYNSQNKQIAFYSPSLPPVCPRCDDKKKLRAKLEMQVFYSCPFGRSIWGSKWAGAGLQFMLLNQEWKMVEKTK